MKSIAIIPCKRISERLPQKNMMRVGGATLVERAVYVAGACDLIVLASDDPDIIAHGVSFADRHRFNAVGHLLTAELAGKRTHLEDVIDDIRGKHSADRWLMLQPTSPLRKRRHVASALAILEQTGCDSVVSVHEVTKEVYFAGTYDTRGLRSDEPGRFTPGRPTNVRMFTNELPKLVCENGAIYAWTDDHWRKTHSRMGGDCRAIEMDADDAIDIDTPAELERAQRRHSGVFG